ncbi:ABC transporter substrate-binding protein [Brevibacillus sp. NRS-1366]|uniref:ABC transporter substrate-binding protein n=1 Tax=Brevibacillus sp. NRS-1366 TaxID=3233899 RepID=UPI003D1F6161
MFHNRKKGRFIACSLAIGLLLASVVGCSSTPAPAPTDKPNDAGKSNASSLVPKNGGTVTIGLPAEPDSLDAQKFQSSDASILTTFMGGALVYQDPKTRELKPHLAESYTTSEDGKTLTFKIRSGVTLHDGTPLTAKSFKDTFDRALAPDMAASLAGIIVSPVKSVSAPDDKTFVIELKEASAPFLTDLITLHPLSMDAIKKFGKEYGRNPVGVGPWKFESWKTGESITLVRNEAYQWADGSAENQGPPRPDKLVIKFIKENSTMVAAMESGSIDIGMRFPAKEANKYRNSKDFTLLESFAPPSIQYVEFNLTNEILQDINVRKAFNMAINKEAIILADLDGEGEPAYGPLPASMFGYDENIEQYAHKFNVEEAKKLLEESGWVENAQGIREKGGKTLSFTMLTSESSPGNQLIQSMLKEIGIDLKIQVVEKATKLEMATNGKFEISRSGYSYTDPDILYLLMHSGQVGGFNSSRINNKQVDSLVEKGRMTMDAGERKKIYEEIQKIVVEQAYQVPLFMPKELNLISKRIHGVKEDPSMGINIQDMWVNE